MMTGEDIEPGNRVAPGAFSRRNPGTCRADGGRKADGHRRLVTHLRKSGAIDWIAFLVGILMLGLALASPFWR